VIADNQDAAIPGDVLGSFNSGSIEDFQVDQNNEAGKPNPKIPNAFHDAAGFCPGGRVNLRENFVTG
jgi:hypothetical protein